MPKFFVGTRAIFVVCLAAAVAFFSLASLWVHSVQAANPANTRLAHSSGVANGVTGLPNTSFPILFIHGLSGGSAADCNSYWSNPVSYLGQTHAFDGYSLKWNGTFDLIGYYTNDTNCNNLALNNWPHCVGYHDTALGTNNEPIEHLACELAWYIYSSYSFNNKSVEIVNHSLGGLIARWALACSIPSPPGPCLNPSGSSAFPPVKLLVRDVVDFTTPNGGLKASTVNSGLLCGIIGFPCVEAQEMQIGSTFMNNLAQDAKYPQGAAGTNWTTMGSYYCGGCYTHSKNPTSGSLSLCQDINTSSTTALGNGQKIWFQSPCYNHIDPGSMLSDTSDTLDAQVLFCNSCGGGAPTWSSNVFPHSLLSMLSALTRLPKLGVVPSPNTGTRDGLTGVATVSTTHAWAVGDYLNSSGMYQTLTEQWNGKSWTQVSSPNAGSSSNFLNGVAAVSASDVWAVGEANTNQALIEQWNGSSWNIVSSPPFGSQFNELLGVAAVSANDVWAVGSYADTQTLVEQWNGSSWNVVPSPTLGSFDSLNAVAAASANDIWAVGSYQGSSGAQTLIEQWNGLSWNVVPSPNISSNVNTLTGVSVVSANNVWAVGYAVDTSGIYHTLIEQWNGSSWNVASSPNPGSLSNSLNGVAAVSANDVWAVGDSSSFTNAQTLIEHWNGSNWIVVSSPISNISTLLSAAPVSANNIWAVGYYTSSDRLTLIDRSS